MRFVVRQIIFLAGVMASGRREGILALTLATTAVGCGDAYHIPPMIAGVVRLDATLSDVDGNPNGTTQITTASGVRVWLMEAGRPVDSTLTDRGVYVFFVTRGHTYRIRTGVPPAFVDSTAPVTPDRDVAFYVDTLRLGRTGDLVSRPNPFPSQVELRYSFGTDTYADIGAYSVDTSRRRVLASQLFVSGAHALLWDGKDDSTNAVPDGLYWLLLQTPTETRAELLLKQP